MTDRPEITIGDEFELRCQNDGSLPALVRYNGTRYSEELQTLACVLTAVKPFNNGAIGHEILIAEDAIPEFYRRKNNRVQERAMTDYWQVGDTYRFRDEIATIGARGRAILMEMDLPAEVILAECGQTNLRFKIPETEAKFFLSKDTADEVYTNCKSLQMSPAALNGIRSLHA